MGAARGFAEVLLSLGRRDFAVPHKREDKDSLLKMGNPKHSRLSAWVKPTMNWNLCQSLNRL